MAISETIELLSLLKALVRAKADLKKDYFQTFIQPVWDSFVIVHKNYIDTSKDYYQEIINAEADPDLALIDKLFHDSLFSRNLITELEELIRNTPLPLEKADKKIFLDFIDAMSNYFKARQNFEQNNLKLLNVRYAFARQIGRQGKSYGESSEEFKKRLKKQIDYFVLEQQERHLKVSTTYYKIKMQLLK